MHLEQFFRKKPRNRIIDKDISHDPKTEAYTKAETVLRPENEKKNPETETSQRLRKKRNRDEVRVRDKVRVKAKLE